nr:hypothetical protein [Pseudomonas sp. PDM20]
MALFECYECTKQISDAAAACPNCGAPVKKKVSEGYIPPKINKPVVPPRRVGLLLAIGIFFLPFIFGWILLQRGYSNTARGLAFGWLILFFVLPNWSDSSKSTSTSSSIASSTSTGPSEAERKEIARREELGRLNALPLISASQLSQAYDENTVAADQMFKDKWFRVSGVVTSINTDFLGKPYVTLKGSANQFMEPQFSFDKDQAYVVAGLRKGTKVVLACEGHGDVAKTPMSRNCKIM